MSDSLDDEVREEPRFRALLSLNVNGVPLHTTNVSMTGLQFSCPDMMLDMIGSDIEGTDLQINLNLDNDRAVTVVCRVIYVWDYGDESLIGLEFKDFDGTSKSTYEGYINDLSQRVPGQ